MMAAGDAGKLALLLDRGAQVNSRAVSGFTSAIASARGAVMRMLVLSRVKFGSSFMPRKMLSPSMMTAIFGA